MNSSISNTCQQRRFVDSTISKDETAGRGVRELKLLRATNPYLHPAATGNASNSSKAVAKPLAEAPKINKFVKDLCSETDEESLDDEECSSDEDSLAYNDSMQDGDDDDGYTTELRFVRTGSGDDDLRDLVSVETMSREQDSNQQLSVSQEEKGGFREVTKRSMSTVNECTCDGILGSQRQTDPDTRSAGKSLRLSKGCVTPPTQATPLADQRKTAETVPNETHALAGNETVSAKDKPTRQRPHSLNLRNQESDRSLNPNIDLPSHLMPSATHVHQGGCGSLIRRLLQKQAKVKEVDNYGAGHQDATHPQRTMAEPPTNDTVPTMTTSFRSTDRSLVVENALDSEKPAAADSTIFGDVQSDSVGHSKLRRKRMLDCDLHSSAMDTSKAKRKRVLNPTEKQMSNSSSIYRGGSCSLPVDQAPDSKMPQDTKAAASQPMSGGFGRGEEASNRSYPKFTTYCKPEQISKSIDTQFLEKRSPIEGDSQLLAVGEEDESLELCRTCKVGFQPELTTVMAHFHESVECPPASDEYSGRFVQQSDITREIKGSMSWAPGSTCLSSHEADDAETLFEKSSEQHVPFGQRHSTGAMYTNDMSAQDLVELESLRRENKELKQKVAKLLADPSHMIDTTSPWPVLHRVRCPMAKGSATYIDKPVWVKDDGHDHLDARRRISDEKEWESKQTNTPFVVYLEYECKSRDQPQLHRSRDNHNTLDLSKRASNDKSTGDELLADASSMALHSREEIHILSSNLKKAFSDLLNSQTKMSVYDEGIRNTGIIYAPYVFYHHFRRDIHDLVDEFAHNCRSDCITLLRYIEEQSEAMESVVGKQFTRGLVTPRLMPYLFCPGEIMIKYDSGYTVAVKLLDKVKADVTFPAAFGVQSGTSACWSCVVESIHFDGKFSLQRKIEKFKFPNMEGTEVAITQLPIFPIHYATAETRSYLLERGKFFLTCKTARYVLGPEQREGNSPENRYMIDADTFKLIHSQIETPANPQSDIPTICNSTSELNPAQSVLTTPIDITTTAEKDESFILRLPPTAKGFHMQDKKWFTLAVDQLRPIQWNESAMDNLAIDNETKELVEALVTNKIEADKGTDVVAGKGTGLIMLLHGGPGTGKTLTAETVAEIAKKPLYRVTCGDIGVHPKIVEEYLERIFLLGRKWGCGIKLHGIDRSILTSIVVLLDEAEVFLEERSTSSLLRNSLVSAFLRALEYYDGILLLTTNRVGTFDEAFRSRLHLALHYESLNEQQRSRIWHNFVDRLERLNVNVDLHDIRSNIPSLATWQMNGRQIRNVVTTARRLANYRHQQVDYKLLKGVIRICKKFDDYLMEVKDEVEVKNLPQEEIMARELGLR